MMVVIADDLSGAAEIAGISWRFGLAAQVQRRFTLGNGIDVAGVNTSTRDATESVARTTVGALAGELNDTEGLWCYKKVDSVLRGHVGAELEVLMRMLHKPRTILAPANPSKGRTIVGGQYRIDNQPLQETDFANDLHYPARSCSVTDLLGAAGGCPVLVLEPSAYQGQEKGIIVAEAESQDDVSRWAGQLDEGTLAAGGSDFFAAVLERRVGPKRVRATSGLVRAAGPKLFLCGSASEYSRQAVKRAPHLGIPLCPMPEPLFDQVGLPGPLVAEWTEAVLEALHVPGQAMVAIVQPVVKNAHLAHRLSDYMAALVESVVGRMALGELILEGGATAEAVLARLGWGTLDVLAEYGPGVVQLRMSGHGNLLVTIKPGSYPWPEAIMEGRKSSK
ncbi:MAG: hypothetical protein MUC88_13760 [Planctomycetes bacterium]|jgi:uncharacterized protein YgbK (DUF1537 family)|nr:hypothetical protein [Planctomycetota bacterium]